MVALKQGRSAVIAALVAATLVGVVGGLYAGRKISRSRPTCVNAVDNYFAVLPQEQRALFDGMSQFGRDAHVRTCREGRWSEAMKSCWVHAASANDIDSCPNEWLNAGSICEQMKREGEGLARRCHTESGAIDCKGVRALGFGIKACIEALRDAECNEIEQTKESCNGALLSPN